MPRIRSTTSDTKDQQKGHPETTSFGRWKRRYLRSTHHTSTLLFRLLHLWRDVKKKIMASLYSYWPYICRHVFNFTPICTAKCLDVPLLQWGGKERVTTPQRAMLQSLWSLSPHTHLQFTLTYTNPNPTLTILTYWTLTISVQVCYLNYWKNHKVPLLVQVFLFFILSSS